MLDKEFIKFEDSGLQKEESYFPQYQITKLDKDLYQFYEFAERKAALCNTRDALKKVASIRGGKPLNRELSAKLIQMKPFQSYTIDNSALKISKCASADDKREPWKLVVAADGNEYFVSATADNTQEEVVEKTAASHIKHVYTVKVTAHNVKEIAKIADMENLNMVPNTVQIPQGNVICFEHVTEETPEKAQASIQKELEGGEIYLADKDVMVCNDTCPCGCGKQIHQQNVPSENTHGQEYVVPCNIPQGDFVLVTLDNPIESCASSVYTLKKYASNKYQNYRIYNDKQEVIAEVKNGIELDPSKNTFADELKAFLDEQIQKKAEDGKVTIFDQTGQEKDPSAELQQGDRVVGADGVSTTVKQVEESQNTELKAEAADEVPVGKNPEDTKATGDDEVKKWKGMREVDDKFVVYITESRERVFDTADEAINYLTRE